MKRSLLAVFGVALLCHACARGAEPLNPAGFIIHRGVNLSHWLSQTNASRDKTTWITERDFEFLRRLGYDHVRLPVDEIELWSEDGRRNAASFRHLANALAWSRSHGLRIIVDLHTVRSHHFNQRERNTLWTDPAAQAKFIRLWDDLVGVLHGEPVDWVAYEIMNEPVADNPADWNTLVAKTVAAIRTREPQRVIIIGSNRWQSATTFPALKVPEGDRNIILSVHSYEPFALTHHAASWTGIRDYKGPVHYPGATIAKEDLMQVPADSSLRKQLGGAGMVWDRAALEAHLRPAIEKARSLGLQLYCGEFGCLPSVPQADRLAWYRDLVGVLEENHIAWANWDYKGGFGIRSAKTGEPDAELVRALGLSSGGN